jgi:hypothetical protein
MIGSTMHYFSMPDPNYNKDYAAGTDPLATTGTKSEFKWSTLTKGDLTYVDENATNTSPHVTIEWKATGNEDIEVVENPKEYLGVTLPTGVTVCESDAVEIPVTVIHQPSVMFKDVNNRVDGKCETSAASYQIDLPLVPVLANTMSSNTVISEASGIKIVYTVAKNGGAAGGDQTATFATLGASGTLSLTVTDFGVYTVTVKSITDRIGEKCSITDPNVSAVATENVFTYALMQKPESGPAYHIPNNF